MPETRLDAAVVTIDGRPLPPDLYPRLTLVRVEESVQLPDTFEIRFEDAHFRLFDEDTFKLGATVQVAFKAEGEPTVVTVGEITAISVEPGASGRHELVLTGLDVIHRLATVPKSRSFQRMTDSDVVTQVAGEYSLEVDVQATATVHEHILQAAETDLVFLRRRAARNGFDVWVSDNTLHFTKTPTGDGTPPTLTWGSNLTGFRVRFSARERCDEVLVRGWDPLGKQPVVATSSTGDPGADAPAVAQMVQAAQAAFGQVQRAATAFPVADQAEAQALAESLMLRASGDQVHVRGEAIGDPAICAGAMVRVEGVGSRLSGSYRITSVVHSYGAGSPYLTRFTCGGKDSAGLSDLLGGTGAASAGAASPGGGAPAMMIGQVTNIDDPEGLCRIRVKLPTLTEDDESAWARVVLPGAGAARGWQWVPQINDEVLVGFELGDTARPLVLGGLWNRTDPPPQPDAISGGEVRQYVMATRSNHRITFDDNDAMIEITLGDGSATLTLDGDGVSVDTSSKVSVTAREVSVEAQSALNLKGASVKIEASGDVTVKGSVIRLN